MKRAFLLIFVILAGSFMLVACNNNQPRISPVITSRIQRIHR